MFPFGPFPGKGHPLMLFDSYDAASKTGHLKGFRYFIWICAFSLLAFAIGLKIYLIGPLTVENFFQREYYISDERYYLYWVMDTLLRHISAEEIIENMDDINHFIDTKYLKNDVRGDKRIILVSEDPLPQMRTLFRHQFKANLAMMFPEYEIVPFKEGDEMLKEVINVEVEEVKVELSDDWY
jgi:hypothetical protein